MNRGTGTLRRTLQGIVVVGAALAHVCEANRVGAVDVEWTFDNAALTPLFNDHTTTMTYVNDTATSSLVTFGTASGFGLPAIPGGDASVMQFPAFEPTQGLSLYDLGPANGGGAFVNQYTMAFDILIPDVAANWFAFFQTNAANTNDSDFFINPTAPNGIGISGQYHGSVLSNTWHRVAVSVDLTDGVGTMKKYIDGTLVFTQTLNQALDGRHSLYTDTDVNPPPTADAFILTDNDFETNAGYISAFYYADRVIDETTIASWGGPTAGGIPQPTMFPPGDVNFDGFVDIFDVNVVSANWGTNGPTGDANGDMIVDIFDVNLISANWSPPPSPVPEPATFTLLVLGCAGGLLWLRRQGLKRESANR